MKSKSKNCERAKKFVNKAGMIGISRKRMGDDLPAELRPWTEVRRGVKLSDLAPPAPSALMEGMFSKDELLMMREIVRELDGA